MAKKKQATKSPIRRTTNVLAIAGSDSAGAAGIQADLKTIAAFGLHGLGVVTAVTAQNMDGVAAVHQVPARHVAAQLRAVLDGFEVAAIKTGMLGSRAAIAAIVDALRPLRTLRLVVDPVLAATSGTPLLSAAALRMARRELFPLATVLTPNVPEAEALLGRRIRDIADLDGAAYDLLGCGASAVLLKGGHLRGRRIRDVLASAGSIHRFEHERLPFAVRGTGCTLATAVACGLARGRGLAGAVRDAEAFLQDALRSSLPAGRSARRVAGLCRLDGP